MELRVFTSSDYFQGEVEICNQLLKEGLAFLHIRKPNTSQDDYVTFVESFLPEYKDCIVIHQFHEMFYQKGCRLLYFSEANRNERIHRNFIGKATCYSSAHFMNDFQQLKKEFDKVFVSPVFPSISKKGYFTDNHWWYEVLPDRQMVALGGIDTDNIKELKDFDAIAVLGYIWEKPEEALNRYKLLCQQIAHMS